MGSLFTAILNSTGALSVYGRVFNTIQSDVANANTPGYTKHEQSVIAAGASLLPGPLLSGRNVYLEQAVRDQSRQLGTAQQKVNDLSRIEPLFDTTGKAGLPAELNNFFDSFSQLSVNPNSSISRQNVLDATDRLATAFNQNSSGISQVSNSIDDQTRSTVSAVNNVIERVADINRHIQANVSAASDPAMEAQLYSSLEELSGYTTYDLVKTNQGAFSLYIGGKNPLVVGAKTFPISADFSGPSTTIRDSQGGDITADLQSKGGTLGAMLEEKNSTLPGYISSLNDMAQTVADRVNVALAGGLDANGVGPNVNLFTYDSNLGAAFTIKRTSIGPNQLAAASTGAPGGNGNAIAISQMSSQALASGGYTFTQAYGNLGSIVGRDLANAKQQQGSTQDLLNQAKQQRQIETGVSLDEEAAKLMQFQQAYQAIGKLVNVLNSLTDTLMNMV
jgi:flagellar hook-associated protein 1 FlgK